MPTISFFFLFLIFFSISAALISAQIHHHHHHRRILHQPFFSSSFDSLPPTAPPTQSPFLSPQFQPHPPPPQQQQQQQQPPKYPFSSQSPPAQNQDPFFPSYPSPPPPPPSTSLATFPANISSLILPRSSSSSKPLSRKLVAVAASVSLVSLLLIVFVAAVLLYHRSHQSSFLLVDDKTNAPGSDSLRLFPPNIPTSDGGGHKPHHRGAPSSTSSEFLYIGTVANPRAPTPQEEEDAANTSSNNAGTSSATGYQKLGSPELHPLPPLPRYHFRPNAEFGSKTADENEEEEFFSPRGSSGGREGSPRTSAASIFQRGMRGVEENFGNRSSNSRAASASYPSSNSASPTRSVTSNSSSSPSHSLPVNLSPRSLRSKSPDSVVDIPPPTRPPPPVPTVPPQSFLTQSPPKSNTSSSPSRGSSDNSPGRLSDVSEQNQGSPARDAGDFVAVKLPPPPPPPLPPRGFWETPAPPTPRLSMGMGGPPVLVAPSRPVVFQNQLPVVSPNEQPDGVEFTVETNEETQKPKLKPLHWDKVRASSDRAMVWDQLKSSSFQLNEQMIETLFMVNGSSVTSKDGIRRQILTSSNQENMVLDPKKSQNIAILLRALNVTIDEVCEALLEGNGDTLGTELLESLLKMAPTKEEERKLKEFKDDSPFKLGPAEKFLKAVLDIPFAFKRVDAMLYIANFDSEVEYLKRSFETLEAACQELRNSRMFMKLLEAVLKTGNRMNTGTNRGDAQAFKLDTLLKLVDIKGTDGKTTLLHFVVQEIIRAEGSRLSGANQNPATEEFHQSALQDEVEHRKLGLQVVSGLSGELTNVKKAAAMDSDVLSSEVAKLAGGITKIGEVLKIREEFEGKDGSEKFSESMNEFVKKAEEEIVRIQAQESVALSLVKELTEYFHGNSAKEEAHPFRIFMVVRDFLSILDQVCKEVGRINERTIVNSARQFPVPENANIQPVFPGFNTRRQYSSSSSSDDDTSSST